MRRVRPLDESTSVAGAVTRVTVITPPAAAGGSPPVTVFVCRQHKLSFQSPVSLANKLLPPATTVSLLLLLLP
jgi:hypothetical protein